MKSIPLLFKRGANNVLTPTPTNSLAKAVLDAAAGWTPRRELTAKASFLLDDEGRWFQYRLLKSSDRPPKSFVETYRSNHKVHGWIPADMGWAYTALQAALKAKDPGEELPVDSVYALVEGDDAGFMLMRPADAEVCEPLAGERLTFKMLTSFFKESMPNLGWEGIVWHGPNGEMLRLGVSDFG